MLPINSPKRKIETHIPAKPIHKNYTESCLKDVKYM